MTELNGRAPWVIDVTEDADHPLAVVSLPDDVVALARTRLSRDLGPVVNQLVEARSAADLRATVAGSADLLTQVLDLDDGLALPDDAVAAVADASAVLATVEHHGAAITDPDELLDAMTPSGMTWWDVLQRLHGECYELLVTRFRPRADGTFTLRWTDEDRQMISSSIAELRSLMTTDDPAIARLFPSPYGDDAERNAGWDVLVRGELIERRLDALTRVEGLFGSERATEDDVLAVMRSINDARLVLGTRLGIEDDEEPSRRELRRHPDGHDLYEHLTTIVGQAVRALSGA